MPVRQPRNRRNRPIAVRRNTLRCSNLLGQKPEFALDQARRPCTAEYCSTLQAASKASLIRPITSGSKNTPGLAKERIGMATTSPTGASRVPPLFLVPLPPLGQQPQGARASTPAGRRSRSFASQSPPSTGGARSMIRGPPWPRGLYRDLDSVNPKPAPAGVGGQPWGQRDAIRSGPLRRLIAVAWYAQLPR